MKSSWNQGKGSRAKGGKGTDGVEEDWSGQGYWQSSREDQFIF